MRAFTDLFIKHPVLAIVVNLIIVLVGVRALTQLPVQQFPNVESSSVIITTVYTGASAETVRGFLTTPIERVVSAISGVDYIESQSRAGVSTVTVRLKLDHDSTEALGRSDRAPAAGALRTTGRGRAARGRNPARGPAVRHVLPGLHLERTHRAADHRLARRARCSRSCPRMEGVQQDQLRRQPVAGHAHLDRPGPARRAQSLARRRAGRAPAQQLSRRGGPDQGQPGADQPAGEHRPARRRGIPEPHRRASATAPSCASPMSPASSSAPKKRR